MEDYFKNKMAAIKSKSKTPFLENDEPEPDWEDEPRCAFQGFSDTVDNDGVSENTALSDVIDNCVLTNNLENGFNVNDFENQPKKKKKKCKRVLNNKLCENTEDLPQKVEKLSKKQKFVNNIQETDVEVQIESKKRKKNKVVQIEDTDIDVSLNKPKKKKKRKNKHL